MGIRPMPWDAWIELDSHYLDYLAIRKSRLKTRGDKVVRTLPGAERATLEVCTELASYLAHRYPSVFRVERAYDSGGLGCGDSLVGPNGGRVKTIEIIPTGDKWDLDHDDPMIVAGLLADDLAIMMEGEDGLYYMQAGSICVPGSWRLEDKIGLPLAEIHLRGNVYKYKEVLEFSMNRFFSKLSVDKPVQRNNYSFQFEPDLSWLEEAHGNEDDFDQRTKIPRRGTKSIQNWRHMEPITDPSRIYFRSERQTLRRMPITGCILFTIRTYLHPVREIVKEAGVPGRLAASIRGWDDAVAARKEKALFADALLPWLDQLHEEQISNGVIKLDDKSDRYPY
ncbi:hypothetical protein Clacol_002494 [Clathrus columnatus]|uniref:DUF3445 domain-containing protein n=1 Tax=Clathrus columnatus TaxID=1419009 RepID=A0AAV5A4Y5_9AGAM|nr:hypothetical protein Clacol_002494 [Clathrus columnatus]